MQRSFMLICAAAMLLAGATAHAQSYPTRPIRIIVPFSAGGPTDLTVRNVAPRLTELLGQSVVVDNRAGAAGAIGAKIVVSAPPDGYTLLMATSSVTSINMVTYAKPPYDTLRDLQPLTPIMTTTSLLVVHPSMPVKTVRELVALAKSHPNQITFGSAGTGGTLHLAIEMLMKETGVKITHVPYKGAAPAVVDVISGQINGMFVDLPVISPYVKAGKVRALAVTSAQRSRYFPDIPTTKEAGYPGVQMTNDYGLLLPAKTPHNIVMKLHDAVVKAVNTPSVSEKLMSLGADPLTMTPEAYTSRIRADIDKWGKLVHLIGLQLDR